MGFLAVPSASNTLANAVFFPSANVGSTLTGLVNGTSYTIYSTTSGPVVTPMAVSPTTPTTEWQNIFPVGSGPTGNVGTVTVVNGDYRVTTVAPNNNGRAKINLPAAGSEIEMEISLQWNDVTRLVCRQVNGDSDLSADSIIFDINRSAGDSAVMNRTERFTVQPGKTMLHFIGVSTAGQYFTINSSSRVRIASTSTAPAQFSTTGWSVSTGSSPSQVTMNITTLPSNGGSAITALQYSINNGTSWNTLTGTGTGSRTLTMAASGTSYTFLVRAVNAIGNGTASATKTATSGAAASTSPTIQNGTFDTDLSGWTFYAPRADYSATVQNAALGTRTSDGRMRITVATNAIYPYALTNLTNLTIGNTYRISVDKSGSTNTYNMVVWNSGTTALTGERARVNNVWQSGVQTIDFVATQTTHVFYIMLGSETVGQFADFDNISISEVTAAPSTAPAQFGTSDWSVATGSSPAQVTMNITTLPSNGGSAITALQYSINNGTNWTTLTGTGTGSRTLTMAANSTSYTFVIRAVNAIGNGTTSASKTATSGAASTTTPTTPVSNIRTFTYQNSLFDHQANGGADDDTRVPNWTQRMAASAGLTYQATGYFGFANQWPLPPRADVGYENVTVPSGVQQWTSTWSGYSNINMLTFVPDNFDSFDRAPNVNSTNSASPIGANQNYRDRLLQIIDAWETNAPMANGEKRKYRVYSGWADFNRSGGQWNTYTTTQLNTYLTYSYGQYQTWYVDLVNMLKTARPNLDIELIDLQRVVMLTWRNTPLNTLTGSRMWEDQAPHGTETWYLLAAMVYYMEIYGVKPPANFNPLAGTGAGSGVDAVMINNWSTIVDYAWTALGN